MDAVQVLRLIEQRNATWRRHAARHSTPGAWEVAEQMQSLLADARRFMATDSRPADRSYAHSLQREEEAGRCVACRQPGEFVHRYRHRLRNGVETQSSRCLCARHAEACARKHGLETPVLV